MKKRFLSIRRGFIFVEALFCLVVLGIAFGLWGFYLSSPKPPLKSFVFAYPTQGIVIQKRQFVASGLSFWAYQKQLQEGDHLYQSFEVVP